MKPRAQSRYGRWELIGAYVSVGLLLAFVVVAGVLVLVGGAR